MSRKWSALSFQGVCMDVQSTILITRFSLFRTSCWKDKRLTFSKYWSQKICLKVGFSFFRVIVFLWQLNRAFCWGFILSQKDKAQGKHGMEVFPFQFSPEKPISFKYQYISQKTPLYDFLEKIIHLFKGITSNEFTIEKTCECKHLSPFLGVRGLGSTNKWCEKS